MRWAAIVVVVLVAGACGATQESEPTTTPPPTTVPTTVAPTTAPTEAVEAMQFGELAIETEIRFWFEDPTDNGAGTFTVSEGSELLGCSTGTFVEVVAGSNVEKTFTCLDGNRHGTFSLAFSWEKRGSESETPRLQLTTPWSVCGGTDDFDTLTGGGVMGLTWTGWIEGTEAFTGTVGIES